MISIGRSYLNIHKTRCLFLCQKKYFHGVWLASLTRLMKSQKLWRSLKYISALNIGLGAVAVKNHEHIVALFVRYIQRPTFKIDFYGREKNLKFLPDTQVITLEPRMLLSIFSRKVSRRTF